MVLAAGTETAEAAHRSVSTNVRVAATVESNCRINTSQLNFGAYDPLVRNRNESDTRDSTQTVFCTKGATPQISIEAMSDLLQEGTPAGATLKYSTQFSSPIRRRRHRPATATPSSTSCAASSPPVRTRRSVPIAAP